MALAVCSCAPDIDGLRLRTEETPATPGADGGNPPAGGLATPAALVAFGGGTSIAVRWSSSSSPEVIGSYDVYRDDAKVGTVKPGFNPEFPEKDGNGFIDKTVEPGAAYEYRVRAVDTNGGVSPLSEAVSVVAPAKVVTVSITIDASKAPDLEGWATGTVKPFLEVWYPKIAQALALPDATPKSAFSVRFDAETDVAGYYDNESAVVLGARLFRANPKYLGSIMHAAAVMVQEMNVPPPWVITGVGEWARIAMLHDLDAPPLGAGQVYLDGYLPAASFLTWIQSTYQKPIVRALTIAGIQKTYGDNLFVTTTGRSIEELWEQWTGQKIRGPGAVRFVALTNKCLDGAKVGTCNGGTGGQAWVVIEKKDGTVTLKAPSGCLEASGGGSTNGTPLQTSACTGAPEQTWKLESNGTLVNPSSGRCLDDPNASTADGTKLQLLDCSGSNGQKIEFP